MAFETITPDDYTTDLVRKFNNNVSETIAALPNKVLTILEGEMDMLIPGNSISLGIVPDGKLFIPMGPVKVYVRRYESTSGNPDTITVGFGSEAGNNNLGNKSFPAQQELVLNLDSSSTQVVFYGPLYLISLGAPQDAVTCICRYYWIGYLADAA